MKKLIICLVGLVLGGVCRAQSFAEWFEQSKTQLKYYAQQVAALQTSVAQLEKGYAIVESGLGMIGQIKSGEFNLHNAFYSSLGTISPTVGKMAEVTEIVALQAAMVERFSAAMSRYRQSGALNAGELEAIGKVYALVVSEGLADVNGLLAILTADELKMSDDERMERVRALDATTRDRYTATTGYLDQADLFCLQGQMEGADQGTVKGLYGLP